MKANIRRLLILTLMLILVVFACNGQTPARHTDGVIIGDLSGISADPTPTKEGQIYWNDTNKVFRQYNGTIWENLGGSTVTKTSDITNDGDDGVNPFITYADIYSSNVILSGNYYHVLNFDYYVWADKYIIDGQVYENYIQNTVTLNASHATLNRIDVIVINDDETISVVTGVEATNPIKPDIDELTQVEVTFVLIVANTTTPSVVVSQLLYDENLGTPSEFSTASVSGGNITVGSLLDPFNGTISMAFLAVITTDYAYLTLDSNIELTDYENIIFHIKNTNAVGQIVALYWEDSATNAGTREVLARNYGYDNTNVSGYQTVIIPIVDFISPSRNKVTSVNRFRIRSRIATASFHIDRIILQGGTNTVEPVNITNTSQLVNDGEDGINPFIDSNVELVSTSDATSHTITLSGSNNSLKLVEGSGVTLTTTGTAEDGIVTLSSTGAATTLGTGTVTATTYGINSDGAANDIVLVEATTTTAGLLGANKWDEIVANTTKISYTDATAVGLNTAKVTESTTVSDTAEIDLTLSTFDISGSIVASSIDETKLDASTNTSLDLADSALQSEVDGSITNELQTIANTSDATSHTVTLSDTGGSVQLIEGTNITITTTGSGLNGIATIASTAGGENLQATTDIGAITTNTITINNAGTGNINLGATGYIAGNAIGSLNVTAGPGGTVGLHGDTGNTQVILGADIWINTVSGGSTTNRVILDTDLLTSQRDIQFPDKSGTLAVTTDIGSTAITDNQVVVGTGAGIEASTMAYVGSQLSLPNNGVFTNAGSGGVQIRANGTMTISTVNQNTNFVRITGANDPTDEGEGGIVVASLGKSFSHQTPAQPNNFQTKSLVLNSVIDLDAMTGNSFHRSLWINPTYNDTGIQHYAIDSERGDVKLTGANVTAKQYNLEAFNTAPANATDTGTLGEIRITATHIYVCTATDVWVRVALATW